MKRGVGEELYQHPVLDFPNKFSRCRICCPASGIWGIEIGKKLSGDGFCFNLFPDGFFNEERRYGEEEISGFNFGGFAGFGMMPVGTFDVYAEEIQEQEVLLDEIDISWIERN